MFILSEDSQRTSGRDAQSSNITAGKAVAESVRTTLGPRGMDKMLVSDSGDVVITNDGATILGERDIEHPAANMIVEVAETQEEEVGDGTTTAAVLAGQLLVKAEDLLEDDVHPTTIVEGYHRAASIAKDAVAEQTLDTDLDDDLLRQVAASSTDRGISASWTSSSISTPSTISVALELAPVRVYTWTSSRAFPPSSAMCVTASTTASARRSAPTSPVPLPVIEDAATCRSRSSSRSVSRVCSATASFAMDAARW
jgi:hypothetical protein